MATMELTPRTESMNLHLNEVGGQIRAHGTVRLSFTCPECKSPCRPEVHYSGFVKPQEYACSKCEAPYEIDHNINIGTVVVGKRPAVEKPIALAL